MNPLEIVKETPTENTPLTPDEVLVRLEQFCAYRERSPVEVRTKIKDLGIEGQTAAEIYQVLETDGFVNEERFAHAYAGGKFRINQWGKVRIRLELQQKGIPARLVAEALDTISETEYLNTLKQLAEKKLPKIRDTEPFRKRQKLAAYLIQAGYETDLVFQEMDARFQSI